MSWLNSVPRVLTGFERSRIDTSRIPVGTMARPHATWSRHITRIPAERAAPISEAEVAALVQRAAAARRHVKVVGGGHSFSDIGLTDGVLVTLDRMRVRRQAALG